ncbi:MAG: ATP-dependent DNA helicase [Clostridia bacterium]|nr:ATP-dependent DNA helicase [Clostridia bacterium]
MSAVFDKETNSIYVNSRELCKFIYRGGSINSRLVSGNKYGSTVVSHKAHTKKPNIVDAYSFTTIVHGTPIVVYTYPEGIRQENGKYVIESVYTVPYFLDDIKNGELDIAIKTAYCDAYILSQRYKVPSIEARITFYKEGGDEERSFKQVLEREELNLYFDSMMDMFYPFAKLIKEKSTCTLSQLEGLRFPFEGGARQGQKDFIIETFRAIKGHRRLVAEAPTGTGKTMASLYPALKSIGNGDADKIFYFTGKTTTAISALNAIDIMREQIPTLRAIHISSKEKCCVSFSPGARRICDEKHCQVTVAYYDKINEALKELLENYKTYTKDIIDTVSRKYSVCSYELSLELSEWCELVVCDYNYLFDPQAYFRRYFDAVDDTRYVFLIDESHNLPDRAREMYSATLNRADFVSIAEKYSSNKHLTDPCAQVLQKFDELHQLAMSEKMELDGKVCGFYINSSLPDDITDGFEEFKRGCSRILNRDNTDDSLHQIFMDVKKFLTVCDIFDKKFTMYIEAQEEEVKLRLLCLDPSFLLDKCMKKGISSILFSATLTPLEYFSDVLGCAKATTLSLPSPFDPKKQCLIGVDCVSTRYADRSHTYNTIANIIRASVAGKKGNYIVYFPSYSYLTEVKEIFTKKYPQISVTVQKKSMSEKAKREFLDSFDAKKEGTLVGFCVLGGSFSEGIDLRGERLIGALIVGVGLPTISSELNIIKEYFDKTRETGYAYAYTYPGMIKVMQAAGRVIRSEDERGIVLLIDDRFASMEYKMIMPEYWKHIKYINNAKDLLGEITEFWKKSL